MQRFPQTIKALWKLWVMLFYLWGNSWGADEGSSSRPLLDQCPVLGIDDGLSKPNGTVLRTDRPLTVTMKNASTNRIRMLRVPGSLHSLDIQLFDGKSNVVRKTSSGERLLRAPAVTSSNWRFRVRAFAMVPGETRFFSPFSVNDLFECPSPGRYSLCIRFRSWSTASNRLTLSEPLCVQVDHSGP